MIHKFDENVKPEYRENIKFFYVLAWDIQNHHATIGSNAPQDTANNLLFN